MKGVDVLVMERWMVVPLASCSLRVDVTAHCNCTVAVNQVA